MAKKETLLSVLKDIRMILNVGSIEKETADVFNGKNYLDLIRSPNRFQQLPDGWFRDNFLSLIYGRNYDWSPESFEKKLTWEEAQKYAATFNNEGFVASQPDDFALISLIDRTKYNPAIIDAAKVLGLKINDWYWTNLTYAANPGYAWMVDFNYGYVNNYVKDNHVCVRPVRSSQ